jgi:hypothetical protein
VRRHNPPPRQLRNRLNNSVTCDKGYDHMRSSSSHFSCSLVLLTIRKGIFLPKRLPGSPGSCATELPLGESWLTILPVAVTVPIASSADLWQIAPTPRGVEQGTAPSIRRVLQEVPAAMLYFAFRAVILDRMRYTLHATTASNAKRKRPSNICDKSFFISEGLGRWISSSAKIIFLKLKACRQLLSL